MTEERMAEKNGKTPESDAGQAGKQSIEVPYAGFWMRFWAYLLDLVVASSLTGIVLFSFNMVINVNELTLGVISAAAVISALTSFVYFTLMTKFYRQTLGKLTFGLKVYSWHNRELTWQDVIFREVVGRFIHQSLGVTNILYVIVAFSPDKRGIHDRIGDTFVGLEPRKTKTIRLPKENSVVTAPDS